ncbi:sialidase family protein [Bacteroides thetaiotaomicron]|uniref:sialidase family protein n=1 Tax=Bacteroides thetaiotaomicron TaxID=818 RepID=UPI0021656015|nr:sialidase family protein [Bacteroides thetaiotaomicron]MCS2364680.1 glycoside hydrolase [Bacteroides thetaiotaomicron]
MKTKTRRLLSLLNFCVLTLLACGNSDGAGEDPGVPYLAKKGEPVDGVRIGWDYGTIRQLATRGGYPRSIRLQDNTVVAVYENYDTGYEMRCSTDEGSTWGDPVILFPIHSITNDKGTARINIANSEIIQLANGDLLAACNYRPQTPEITPFAIAVRRSTDNGVTWSDPQIIYEAEPRFSDGCWEPSFLQLPNGEVQVYFANEGPYTHSNEQEISMMTSVDNGKTWGGYKTVCFRAGSRDGMPVSKVVGDEIVCVIEDCGFVTFKPYTVRTKLSDNWSSPVLADSPNRAMALGEPVEDWIYMGVLI